MITKTYIIVYLTTTYYNNELYIIVEGVRQSGRAGKKTNIFFCVCPPSLFASSHSYQSKNYKKAYISN